ncbi:MAG: alpha/beta hydrolase [Chloroflexota bacterium]
MNSIKADTLKVPGATLYYETRGAGPLLLLIAGGAGDAESYNGIANELCGHYTVVTYDRRGYIRSPLDNPEQLIEIATHSEDVSHLLSTLSHEPAYVFGCSIGAVIGLDLTVRHSEQVSTLVADEPPLSQFMPDKGQPPNLSAMYQQGGATEALRQFAASLGVDTRTPQTNLGLPQKDAEAARHNKESFFKHDMGAVSRYRLDVVALMATPTRIVVAGGREGRAYFPYQCAAALAENIGTPLVEFPGNHAGFVRYPKEFAQQLDMLLTVDTSIR